MFFSDAAVLRDGLLALLLVGAPQTPRAACAFS